MDASSKPNIQSWLRLYRKRRHETRMIWLEKVYSNARVNGEGRTMSSNGSETIIGQLGHWLLEQRLKIKARKFIADLLELVD